MVQQKVFMCGSIMFLLCFCLTQTYKNKHIETKITQVILGEAEIGASSGNGIV